jgi:hypothetical protein
MNLSTYEQLKEVDKLKGEAKKKRFLNFYKESLAIRVLIEVAYSTKLKWLLPEGDPPFKKTEPESDLQNVLKKDSRKLVYFLNTKEGQNIKSMKREMMFIEFLESIDHQDQTLILSVKNKKLPFKSINKKFLNSVIPEITKNW